MKYQWAIFNVQENIGIVLLRPGPLHTPRVPIVVLVRIMHSMLGHFILVGMVVVSTMEEAEKERDIAGSGCRASAWLLTAYLRCVHRVARQ